MELTNLTLLNSQESLQKLASRDLRGVFALRLADILEEAESRLEKLHGIQKDLAQRIDEEDLTQKEADEQWQELLQETLQVEEEPLPRSALRSVEISVADLKVLDWMIAAEKNTNTAQNDNAN